MFVKRYYRDYELIFFIDANTNLTPQLVDIAKQINNKLCHNKLCISENPLYVKNNLKDYLKSKKSWLIVLDGLKINENHKVQEFIEWKHNGHIIICSQDTANMIDKIATSNISGQSIKAVINKIIGKSDEKFKNKLASALCGYPTYLIAHSTIFFNNNNHLTIDEYIEYMKKNDNKIRAHLEVILKQIPKVQQEKLFKLSLINNQKIPEKLISLLIPQKHEFIEFINNTVRFGILEQVNGSNNKDNRIFRMHDSIKDELLKIRGNDKLKNDLNEMLDLIDKMMPESIRDRLTILRNNTLLESNIEILLRNADQYNASYGKMIQVGQKLLWYYLIGSRQTNNAKNLVEWFKKYNKEDKFPIKTDKVKIDISNFLTYVAGFEYSISNVPAEIAMSYLDKAENLINDVSNEGELTAYIYAIKAHI